MAGQKLLSEAKCKAAKPKQKMYYLNDGGGLRLRCRKDGGKTWMFRYYYNKTEKSIGIGPYPKITSIATLSINIAGTDKLTHTRGLELQNSCGDTIITDRWFHFECNLMQKKAEYSHF